MVPISPQAPARLRSAPSSPATPSRKRKRAASPEPSPVGGTHLGPAAPIASTSKAPADADSAELLEGFTKADLKELLLEAAESHPRVKASIYAYKKRKYPEKIVETVQQFDWLGPEAIDWISKGEEKGRKHMLPVCLVTFRRG